MQKLIVDSAKVLVSGFLVYAVMAACAVNVEDTPRSGPSTSPVPNAMADQWYASGSRLKIRFYEYQDGAKQFAGMFDSERGEECGFGLHADGTFRCLPAGDAIATVYSNNVCTAPVALVPKGQAPKLIAQPMPNGSRRLFVRGQAYGGAIYQGITNACTQTSPDVPKDQDAWKAGDEVPSGSFVAAAQRTGG